MEALNPPNIFTDREHPTTVQTIKDATTNDLDFQMNCQKALLQVLFFLMQTQPLEMKI